MGKISQVAGLRRVDWVRLNVEDEHLTAEVVGSGGRLPCVRPIPVAVAARLIASGVPHVTHHSETGPR